MTVKVYKILYDSITQGFYFSLCPHPGDRSQDSVWSVYELPTGYDLLSINNEPDRIVTSARTVCLLVSKRMPNGEIVPAIYDFDSLGDVVILLREIKDDNDRLRDLLGSLKYMLDYDGLEPVHRRRLEGFIRKAEGR